ncbi:MAG: SPASM domain-containing protein, partial [Gemmatimonadota bacterium]
MTMTMSAAEFKQFSFGGQRVVLDVRRCRLHRVDEVASRLLSAFREVGTRRRHILARVQRQAPAAEVKSALAELEKVGLVHRAQVSVPHLKSPKPQGVSAICLHVTHNCNLRCKYCYGDGGSYGSPGEVMSPETAKSATEFLFDQLRRYGRPKGNISLFGGEPLLRWGFLRMLIPLVRQRAREEKKGIGLSVFTNATLLSGSRARFLHRYRVRVNVSLDGPARVHDRKRVHTDGSGSYGQVRRGIELLRRERIPFSIRATLDPVRPELTAVVNHALRLGARGVHAELASGVLGRSSQLSARAVVRATREYRLFTDYYIRMMRRRQTLVPYHGYVRFLDALQNSRRKFYGCGMGREYVAIAPQGDIYPCHRLVGQQGYLLGNLRTGLSGRGRSLLRGLHAEGRRGCSTCWARYLCGGGCYYEAVLANGGLEHPSPAHCRLMRETI